MPAMRRMQVGWALAAAALLAGCGSSSTATMSSISQAAPSSTTPAFIEAERAEAAFERKFRQQYMEGSNKGFLQAATVRFRTPCHTQEGGGKWTCEGWGMEATGGSENCFLATATATESGVQGELQTRTESPHEPGGFDVCAEGAKEGQPPGDYNAEG
jgi:hypothetical protein